MPPPFSAPTTMFYPSKSSNVNFEIVVTFGAQNVPTQVIWMIGLPDFENGALNENHLGRRLFRSL